MATDGFLAHYDLHPGQKFYAEIRQEINSCDVFISLISENYRTSEHANQELGIAAGLEKLILPICIDNTRPSAFIFGVHCVCCEETEIDDQIVNIEIAITNLINWENKTIDPYIERLGNSESWAEAAYWAQKLQGMGNFTVKQVTQIGNAIIANNQVRNSFAARPSLRIILEKHQNDLPSRIRSELTQLLNLTD